MSKLACTHVRKNKASGHLHRIIWTLLLFLSVFASSVLGKSHDDDDADDCSLEDTMRGYQVLMTFSSCSGVDVGEVQAVYTRVEADKDLQKLFQNKAIECSGYSGSRDRQLCLGEYMALFAEENILPAEQDLVNTCACLTETLDDLPTCGIFSSIAGITKYDVLPTTMGVCGDIASVCSNVDSFASICLDSGIKSYSSKTCSAVEESDLGCDASSEFLWNMGTDSLQFCNLDSQTESGLRLFSDSCPEFFSIEKTETETATTITKQGTEPIAGKSESSQSVSWIFGFLGLAIVAGALYLGNRFIKREGLYYEFMNGNQAYSPVPMAENDFVMTSKSDTSPFHL